MADSAREKLEPAPIILGDQNDVTLTNSLFDHVWTPKGKGFWFLFLIAFGLMNVMVMALGYTVAKGIGVWGNNIPVGWAFGIVNFVWWIGIGHAGTLISAILLLLQQKWRTSINRFSPAAPGQISA